MAELIEHLKSLPAEEREAFARRFHELERSAATVDGKGNGGASPASWPDFGARLKRIYGDKVVADSKAVISSARGDW